MKLHDKKLFSLLLLSVFFTGTIAYGQNASSPVSATNFPFTRNLTLGTQGSDVVALQQFLITDGFLKISTSTDYFGSLTKTALSAWQASVGISPSSGFFGPISIKKINENATTTIITTTADVINKSPAHLIIPKLGINANFQNEGMAPDGTMEVPNNIYDVGWFTGSVEPGKKGVSIIIGHVAQIRGGVVTKPGVFSNLNTLIIGDTLSVIDSAGATTTFVVRAIRSYDPNADASDVFTSTDNNAHLNLITCEGTWNATQASYSQRLVVFTDAVQ
jgi:sortase (surface protein transpeptidase)